MFQFKFLFKFHQKTGLNIVFSFFMVFGTHFVVTGESKFPNEETRLKIVEKLGLEIERTDGEGILVRDGKPRTFQKILEQIKQEAKMATNWQELSRAFAKLDMAYPNLHASYEPGNEMTLPERLTPLVRFSVDWLAPTRTVVRISSLDKTNYSNEEIPKRGDLLLEINGKPVSDWMKENFDFCKWPIKEQCDLEFPKIFFKELSGWTRKDPLVYTLKRDDKIWKVNVPVEERKRSKDTSYLLCQNNLDRYFGFKPVYIGKHACFFQNDKDPSTMILRISTFMYKRNSQPVNDKWPDQEKNFKSVKEEVDAFRPFWQEMAPKIKNLVLDVSDNGGGNEPTPYYEIFFDRPYQEQWVRFRKIKELDDSSLRNAIFWNTTGQEIWFQNLKKEKIWDSVVYGDFLPPVPMFCASDSKDCREDLFPVRPHGFKGKVSLILNHSCVSSCDGFVFAFKAELGERVTLIGQFQAADTAYSRIRFGVRIDQALPNGFEVVSLPQYGKIEESFAFSQVVVITRSVKHDGTVVSGKPLSLDHFVPNNLEQNGNWHMEAVKTAIENFK